MASASSWKGREPASVAGGAQRRPRGVLGGRPRGRGCRARRLTARLCRVVARAAGVVALAAAPAGRATGSAQAWPVWSPACRKSARPSVSHARAAAGRPASWPSGARAMRSVRPAPRVVGLPRPDEGGARLPPGARPASPGRRGSARASAAQARAVGPGHRRRRPAAGQRQERGPATSRGLAQVAARRPRTTPARPPAAARALGRLGAALVERPAQGGPAVVVLPLQAVEPRRAGPAPSQRRLRRLGQGGEVGQRGAGGRRPPARRPRSRSRAYWRSVSSSR